MPDQTNWGTVAIAALGFYALYTFFGNKSSEVYGTTAGSGTLGSTYTERIYNYESIQRDKYADTLSNEQKMKIVQGNAIDSASANANKYSLYNPSNIFGVSTYTQGAMVQTVAMNVRPMTAQETATGNNLLSISKTSDFAKKATNVIGGNNSNYVTKTGKSVTPSYTTTIKSNSLKTGIVKLSKSLNPQSLKP